MSETSKPRTYRSREEKLDILSRSELSELTTAQFCEQEGVHPSTLYKWRRSFDNEQPQRRTTRKKPQGNDFLELSSPGAVVSGGELELSLPHGIVLRVRL